MRSRYRIYEPPRHPFHERETHPMKHALLAITALLLAPLTMSRAADRPNIFGWSAKILM